MVNICKGVARNLTGANASSSINFLAAQNAYTRMLHIYILIINAIDATAYIYSNYLKLSPITYSPRAIKFPLNLCLLAIYRDLFLSRPSDAS